VYVIDVIIFYYRYYEPVALSAAKLMYQSKKGGAELNFAKLGYNQPRFMKKRK
jgi:hypothetical protein